MTDERSPSNRGYMVFERILREANRADRAASGGAITRHMGDVAGCVGLVCAIANIMIHYGNVVPAFQRLPITIGLAITSLGFLASWAYSVRVDRKENASRRTDARDVKRISPIGHRNRRPGNRREKT